MIRLDRQLFDVRPKVDPLRLDQCPAVGCDLAREDRLLPLRTPDEVIDDEVDPMFVSWILHVDSIQLSTMFAMALPGINGLKPVWRNPPNHGLKLRGLRRVRFGQESRLIGREHSLVNQLLAVGNAVVEIDSQGRDGCPANGSAAHKARAVPAEVAVPLVTPRIE